MNKRLIVVFPDGKRRQGYATTEHSASNYGIPVILIDKTPHGFGDLSECQIITNDPEAVEGLKKAGFSPISRVSTSEHKGIAFPADISEKIQRDAEANGVNFSKMVVKILREYYLKKE